MKKLIIFLTLIILTSFVNAQNTQVVTSTVKHGDTSFILRITNSFSLDSVFRTEYQYHDECDSVLVSDTMRWVCVTITDSIQYWYKYRTFTGATKDSVQLNNIPHKTINNNPIIGVGDLTISGGSGVSQQTLNDTATAIRTTVNSKAASNHNHDASYQPIGSYLVAADIAGKQNTISLTTAGTSGAATFNGTTLNIPNYATGGGVTRVFLPSDVVNNNAVANTIADVTGLSFPVLANTTYQFRFVIVYSSAATTTGSRWSINGPAATHMSYTSQYTLTATSITNNAALAGYNLPAASNASSLTTNNRCIIEGEIRPSANGTVIARFASEILSSAITAVASGRSYVEYQIIN